MIGARVVLQVGALLERTLLEDTHLESTLLEGTLLEGALLEGTLLEGTLLDAGRASWSSKADQNLTKVAARTRPFLCGEVARPNSLDRPGRAGPGRA